MTSKTRLANYALGILAGLVAAAVMLFVMAVGRNWIGISPLPEAIPDRIAPTLSIQEFFRLFGKYGGYNGLKKFGVKSGIQAIIAAGAIFGLIYAIVVESRRSRAWLPWRHGFSRLGIVLAVVLVSAMWIATLIFLWPNLHTNYRGLPPSQARIVNGLGYLVTYVAFAASLMVTYRFVARRPVLPIHQLAIQPDSDGERASLMAAGQPSSRRAILAAAAGALVALPTVWIIRKLYDRATFPYDGTVYSGPGVQPLVPADKFYTVTKNVVDPNIRKSLWALEISGEVERTKTYRYDDLTAMTPVVQETTLMCISNAIGAGLSSNAIWTGVRMRDLLNDAGVRDSAVEVKLLGADGYTDTFAIEKALEPTTLVVYEINGEPLPERHGYPVRVIVPGLYGEKNVKWVTGIEVVDHDAKGFYESQGWGPNFVVPTRSDIFSPKRTRHRGQDSFDQAFPVNQSVSLRGRAFAGDRGVEKVEVSLDDGETWQPATIDYPGTKLTWVFWSYRWTPTTTGDYVLVCRATDQNGDLQTSEVRGTAPQGATGLHKVKASVI